MLSTLSLSKKLTTLVVTALIALAIVAADGILSLRGSIASLNEISNLRLPSVLGLEIVSEGQTAIRSENRMVGFLLEEGKKGEDFKKTLVNKRNIWQRIDKGWKIYEPLPRTSEEEVIWKRFLGDWEAWKKAELVINEQIEKLIKANSEETRSQAKQDYLAAAYTAVPFFDKSEAALGQLVELNVRLANEATQRADEESSRSTLLMTSISLISCIALALLGTAIARNIFATIGGEPHAAKEVVERISSGDLTQRLNVRPGDQSSLIANQAKMQANLQTIVRDIAGSVAHTENSADSLSSAAQQVASASADTADAASSMAASVEELSVSISQVSENAQSALHLSERTGKLSASGSDVIERAVAEINQIAETVRLTSSSMNTLNENSKQISTVVQVIKDVADQTNLLALNAAIEAARAGEAGRGFAVVADEVRKLAERTTSATVEIGNMISRIQSNTTESVDTMEHAVEQVDKGVSLAREAGEAIREIRTSVTQVVDTVNDIVNSIQEQSVASQQIAQRVERVAQSSEENNAASQQTAESAAILKQLAQSLKGSIGQFRTA